MSSKPCEGEASPHLCKSSLCGQACACSSFSSGRSGFRTLWVHFSPSSVCFLGLSTPASKKVQPWGGFIPLVSVTQDIKGAVEVTAGGCSRDPAPASCPLLPLGTPQPKHKLGFCLARICHRLKQTRSAYSLTNCSFQALKTH